MLITTITKIGDFHMDRDAAIKGLLGKAKSNRGVQTDEEKQRQQAVDFLAGKRSVERPVRPEVRDLLNGGRR